MPITSRIENVREKYARVVEINKYKETHIYTLVGGTYGNIISFHMSNMSSLF
jgi:hypothetical protein